MNYWFSVFRIWAVFKKEIVHLCRDPLLMICIVGAPIVEVFLYATVINLEPRHIPTGVVCDDDGNVGRAFVASLEHTEFFKIVRFYDSPEEAKKDFLAHKIFFLVSIPPDFSKKIIRSETPSVLLESNEVNLLYTTPALATVAKIPDLVVQRELSATSTIQADRRFEIRCARHFYNPDCVTYEQMTPCLIGLIVTSTLLFATILSITNERESGTMENLLSMPTKSTEIVLAKISPYYLIGFFQIFIVLFLSIKFFHLPFHGRFGDLFLVAAVYVPAILAVSVTISSIVKTNGQGLQAGILFLLPNIFLTDFALPFYGMPAWAQKIGDCLPMTWLIRLYRCIIVEGRQGMELWPNFWPLLVLLAIAVYTSVRFYRTTLD